MSALASKPDPLEVGRRHLLALRTALGEAREALETGALAPLTASAEMRALLLELALDASQLAAALPALVSGTPVDPVELPRGGARVLAVDDDEATLNALRELLAPEFDLVTTTDPHAAPFLARQVGAEAVLCDLRMPRLDGRSLTRLLRADPETAGLPVLLVSGARDTAEKLGAFEAGAFDYLTKPVDADELAARLRNAVARSRELRGQRALQETDDLTGLPNRRSLRRLAEAALQDAQARGRPLSVAMLDMDGLKPLNDRHGHAAGDAGLAALARALRAVMRGGDLAARLGGDEFALVMPGAELAGARAVLVRLEAELARGELELPSGAHVRLAASAGLAQLAPGDTLESLLARADQALYAVKSERKSR